jgi:predicted RNA-binding protein with PIN domain
MSVAEPDGPADPEEPDELGQEQLGQSLPAAVRARVVRLASDGLGELAPTDVPNALRAFARFRPTRRAHLAGTPIAAALERDDAFRGRIAARVREALPDVAAAVAAGQVTPAADPLDIAAVAYLLRPPGWTGLVRAAADHAGRGVPTTDNLHGAEIVARLQEQVVALRALGREEVARLRAQLGEARGETAELRRRLHQARTAAGEAGRAAEAARAAESEARAEAAAAAAAGEAELRRLRLRLTDADAAAESSRRAAREGRSADQVRLRLLLDTVVEGAAGLRRELALPPTTVRPADGVTAQPSSPPGPHDLASRALASDDPVLLDQLLALPQVHLVVDGYNVTMAGYGSSPLLDQRRRLVSGLAVLAAQSGAEITCCFDGAAVEAPVGLVAPRGVRVLFSLPGETADELIRRLVRAEPQGRPVVVVSSDREVADGVHRAGARCVPSLSLLRRLARA